MFGRRSIDGEEKEDLKHLAITCHSVRVTLESFPLLLPHLFVSEVFDQQRKIYPSIMPPKNKQTVGKKIVDALQEKDPNVNAAAVTKDDVSSKVQDEGKSPTSPSLESRI